LDGRGGVAALAQEHGELEMAPRRVDRRADRRERRQGRAEVVGGLAERAPRPRDLAEGALRPAEAVPRLAAPRQVEGLAGQRLGGVEPAPPAMRLGQERREPGLRLRELELLEQPERPLEPRDGLVQLSRLEPDEAEPSERQGGVQRIRRGGQRRLAETDPGLHLAAGDVEDPARPASRAERLGIADLGPARLRDRLRGERRVDLAEQRLVQADYPVSGGEPPRLASRLQEGERPAPVLEPRPRLPGERPALGEGVVDLPLGPAVVGPPRLEERLLEVGRGLAVVAEEEVTPSEQELV